MRTSVRVKWIAVLSLLCITAVIWGVVFREDRGGLLAVSFLSVGQGNAVYIEAPSGRQVLIDGGPDGGVLRQLGAAMPPWDRSLDVVIATSPDQDDVSGLVDVLQRYEVGTVIQTSIENSSPMWSLFEKEAATAKIFTAKRGQVVDLGEGAYLEILFPDRAALGATPAEGCVVAHLVYGKTSFMLPCDAPIGVQNYLAMLDGTSLRSDVVQLKNISPIFLGYVSPTYAIYSPSCAKKASFAASGDAFTKFNIQRFDTCTDGTITFVSDGQTVSRK